MSDDKKKEEERKKAGLPFWMSGAKNAAGALASGGVGAGGGAAAAGAGAGAKIALAVLMAVTGATAFSVGRARKARLEKQRAARAGAAIFTDKDAEAAAEKALPGEGSNNSSLGMVSAGAGYGSAELEAARRRAEEEKAAAEGQGGDGKAAQASAAPSMPDIGKLVASAAGPAPGADGAGKKGGLPSGGVGFTKELGGGKTGAQLSNNFGLNSGVGGKFERSQLGSRLQPFSKNGKSPGRASALIARGPNGTRGIANRQLTNAALDGRRALNSSMLETQSAAAGRTFDGTMPSGTAITGNGAAIGGAGPQGGGYGGGGNGGGGYGPAPNDEPGTGKDCTGQCMCDAQFPSEGRLYVPGVGCQVPDTGGKSVDPTDDLIKYANILLGIAVFAGTLQLLVRLLMTQTLNPVAFGFLMHVYHALGWLMMALGVGLAAIGMLLLGMGREDLGAMWTAIGAVITGLAWWGNSNTAGLARQAITPLVNATLGDLGQTDGAIGSQAYSGERHFNPKTGQWEDGPDPNPGGYQTGDTNATVHDHRTPTD